MKMEMETYWPQHKVFLLATLALFPEKLNGMEAEPLFYWAYFGPISNAVGHDYSESDYEHLNTILFYYQRDGYLTYEQTSHGLFEIKGVNTEKAKHDLTNYLKKWQNGHLVTNDATKPPDVSYQQELLTIALQRSSAKHQSEPRIQPSDIFDDISKLDYEPPFWELILSTQLLDSNLELANIGYERKNGLFYKTSQPYADVSAVSDKLAKLLKRGPVLPKPAIKHKASLVFTKSGKLRLTLDGEQYLLQNYKSEKNNTYRVVQALYDANSESLTRGQLNLKPNSKTMLKPLIANANLAGIIGELFIEYEDNAVRLKHKSEPTEEQHGRLLKYVNGLGAKNN